MRRTEGQSVTGFVRATILLIALTVVTILSTCSAVHIRTGPPTDAEATQRSEDQGRRFRTEWADRLQRTDPINQAEMLRVFLDSTTTRFIRFGRQINDWWREESKRRGVQVPIEQVRAAVERSSQIDLPLLDAYEDVLEYGVTLIKEARFFDSPAQERLVQYRDLYLETYSAVFYPNGTREEFDLQLQGLESRTQQASRDLEAELARYR
ncbi:MAG: hypothetical protein AB1772_08040 [Candidatus Zixiibacteriota bacterium]